MIPNTCGKEKQSKRKKLATIVEIPTAPFSLTGVVYGVCRPALGELQGFSGSAMLLCGVPAPLGGLFGIYKNVLPQI
jgi:hypothetical protein